ncbi:MAG TPA: hypothetical protein VFJ82_15235 [Longimicrobium sp.]|nr:hypothetical protein [Longimicrobium sp.]
MSRTIELPDDVYARVEEAASASGNSVAEVIATRFPALGIDPCSNGSTDEGKNSCANGAPHPPRTLADEFAGRVGLVSSGRGDLARRAGELFAEGMAEKKREGRL